MRIPAHRVICVCLGSLCANLANAQYSGSATMQLGMGYGNIALSQSILTGTAVALGPHSSHPSTTTPRRPASTNAESALTYIPDAGQSERTRTAMIQALSQNNPQLRTQVQQAFANDAMLKSFDSFMSNLGYSSRNVADDMAVLLLVSWEIATDANASSSQIQGADTQVHNLFLHSTQLQALSNAQRQEMAEQIAYQVVLGFAAKREYTRTGDQAQLAHLRDLAASVMRQQGIDLRNVRLTEQGFSLRK